MQSMHALIFPANFCKGLDPRVKKTLGLDVHAFKTIIFDPKSYKEVG